MMVSLKLADSALGQSFVTREFDETSRWNGQTAWINGIVARKPTLDILQGPRAVESDGKNL